MMTEPGACLEEMLVGGARLTFAWCDMYERPEQLAPLDALMESSLAPPDAVLMGVGAWHAYNTPAIGLDAAKHRYALAMSRLFEDVATMVAPRYEEEYARPFADRPAATTKVWLSMPSCGMRAALCLLR